MNEISGSGAVVITTAKLPSTEPELRFFAGSKPACGMSEIRHGEDLWQWSRLEMWPKHLSSVNLSSVNHTTKTILHHHHLHHLHHLPDVAATDECKSFVFVNFAALVVDVVIVDEAAIVVPHCDLVVVLWFDAVATYVVDVFYSRVVVVVHIDVVVLVLLIPLEMLTKLVRLTDQLLFFQLSALRCWLSFVYWLTKTLIFYPKKFFLYFRRKLAKPKKQKKSILKKFLIFLQKKFSPYFKVTANREVK